MNRGISFRGICVLASGGLLATSALASNIIPNNFYGANQTVNGFQDNFTSADYSNYTEVIAGAAGVTPTGSGNFNIAGGYLNITGGGGDPNKLLYDGASYNASNQNVLAMIEVTNVGSGDGFRGGVGAQSSSVNGQGINTLFRVDGNNGSGNHMNLLNDAILWGPNIGDSTNPSWAANTFYWVRETTVGSSIKAEIWPADGSTPEGSAMSTTWTQGGRSGLAGLVADSSGGTGTFQVNYLLIQASGLPQITALPEPASLGLIGLGAIGLLARRRHA